MTFHIPFTISNIEKLKGNSKFFSFSTKKSPKSSKLQKYLDNADVKITANEYISICSRSFTITLCIFYLIATTALVILKVKNPYLISLGLALLLAVFVFFIQVNYPKIYDSRRVRNIEKNLIPALQDMIVQLNEGIPLFDILVNISSSEYKYLSEEFKKAVKKINAGLPQIEVLEELGERNSSIFFKRTLWQISNGMRAGSDVSVVIKESTSILNKEQLLQIQTYGNKLNPMIMFYMLMSVIMPALSIAFFTIISSMVGLPGKITTALFIGMLVFVTLLQIMFLGMIRSIRPSLL